MVQLVKQRADLEREIDGKLKALHNNHEKECQRLEVDAEAKKQKLNDDYQKHVSVLFCCSLLICFSLFYVSR